MTQKYQVKVSMKQAAIVETGIVLKQGDFGMQIEIEVLDFDATGTTPQIVFRKAMGAVESTTITVSSNKYTYTFKGTELDTPGKVFCDLKLKNSTTQRISTASFMFKVVADTLDGLAEESSSYSDTIAQIVGGFDGEIDSIKTTFNNGIQATNTVITDTDRLTEISYIDTNPNFWLNENGMGNQQTGYIFNKYPVGNATLLYVDVPKSGSPTAFRFCANQAGNGAVIGDICHFGYKGYVIPPAGGNYFFAACSSSDTIKVYNASNMNVFDAIDTVDAKADLIDAKIDQEIDNTYDDFYLSFENKISFTSGGYINLSGSTANVLSPNSSDVLEYAVVPCNPGDRFLVNIVGGGAGRAWGFVKNNGTIINKADAYATVSKQVLTAPEEAGLLVLNNNFQSGGYSKSFIENKDNTAMVQELFGNISSAIGSLIKTSPNLTNADYWLGFTGGGEQKAGYTFDRYQVTSGSTIYLKVNDSGAPTKWRFASSDSGSTTNIVGELHRDGFNGFIQVPDTATYIFISRETTDTASGVYYPAKQAGIVRGPIFMFVTDTKLNIICGDTAYGFVGRKYMSLASWSKSETMPSATTCAIIMTENGFKLSTFQSLGTNDIIIAFVWGRRVSTLGQPLIITNDAPLISKWYQRENIPVYVNNKKIKNYAIGLRAGSAKDFGYFYKFENAYLDSGERWRYCYGDQFYITQDFSNNGVFEQNTVDISNKKILCIGDSFTARGWYQKQIKTHEPTVEFIGTRETNYNNYMSEGYSGASANQIFGHYYKDLSDGQTKVSPFWNPTTEKPDFSYYCTQNNMAPDYVIIMFGLNETNEINYYNAVQDMVSQIKDYDPNIITYVVEPMVQADLPADVHTPTNQGYRCGLYWYILEDCVKIPGRTILIDEYDYDTGTVVYGYGVNAHDGVSDAVHPSETVGFKKIGDQIYNWLGESSN